MNCLACQTPLTAAYIQWNELMQNNSVIYTCNNLNCKSRYSYHKVKLEVYHNPPNIQNIMGYNYVFLNDKDETRGYCLSGNQSLDTTSLEVITISKPFQQSFNDGYIAFNTNQIYSTQTIGYVSSTTTAAPPGSYSNNNWGNGGSITLTGGIGGTGGALTIAGGSGYTGNNSWTPPTQEAIQVKYVPISIHNTDQELLKIYKRLKNLIIYS